MRRFAIALALVFAPSAVQADAGSNPGADLKKLVDTVWDNTLKQSPIFASSLGDSRFANEVGEFTLAAQDRQAQRAAGFLKQLDAIPAAELSLADAVEAAVLRRSLQSTIRANTFGQRAINFSTYSGWHQNFAAMPDNVPLKTAEDFASYNRRLKQYARVNDESLGVGNAAIKGKFTLPCEALGGYEKSITGLITTDERQSRFFAPYTWVRPEMISEDEWNGLASQAIATINAMINPALQKHLDWYQRSYKPACAKLPGVSAQPDGAAYYAFRIAEETTTSLSADEIHQIGLHEVARIGAEMDKIAATAGANSRMDFINALRTDPKYTAKTPEELMEKVARITKTIDGKMPTLFRRLSRLPYGIREIPAEIAEGTTTAYYAPGSPAIGVAGTYYVNTSKLDQRPLWEIPALSLHEAVPGHHHQIALQQELPLSEFRKNGAFFTAFVEGWGLYAESLGHEMGLYDSPEKKMGQLSYEAWRACRLVVDTGLHAKGWSKQKAIDFMTANTALSKANIEAEVNRYISWPGQALAYKLGELKIKELRALATRELGAKFDLAAFHDAVLGQGAVPLDVLDAQIRSWIATQNAKM